MSEKDATPYNPSVDPNGRPPAPVGVAGPTPHAVQPKAQSASTPPPASNVQKAPKPLKGGFTWLFTVVLVLAAYLGVQSVAAFATALLFSLRGVSNMGVILTPALVTGQVLALVVFFPWYRHVRRGNATRPIRFKREPPDESRPLQPTANPQAGRLGLSAPLTLGRRAVANPRARILARVLLLVILGLCLQVLTSLFLSCVLPLAPAIEKDYGKLMASMPGDTLLGFVSLVILAPLNEEVVFRGLTLQYGRRVSRRAWVPALVSAAAFGIAHGNLVQSSYTFAMGYVFARIALSAGGLVPSMILHAALNCSSYLVDAVVGGALRLGSVAVVALGAVALLVAIASYRLVVLGRVGKK